MSMEKVLSGRKEILTKGHNFTLEYYLTTRTGGKSLLYGIEIVKKQNGTIIEKESVHNISDVYATVEKIIKKLITYCVTPITMLSILDDLGESDIRMQTAYKAS